MRVEQYLQLVVILFRILLLPQDQMKTCQIFPIFTIHCFMLFQKTRLRELHLSAFN